MSCFAVEILDTNTKILEIETCIGNEPSNIEVINYDNNTLIIEQCPIILPSEFSSLIDAEIASFIKSGSGINLNANTSGLIISISGLNSVDIGNFNEAVDDRIGNGLLSAGSGISILYNDSLNILTIGTTGLQPSGNYATIGHTHTISDIINISGVLPNTIVYTTGNQIINGVKTFLNGTLSAGLCRFSIPDLVFQIDNGDLDPNYNGNALRLSVGADGLGYVTNLQANNVDRDIVIMLPYYSGTLALLSDINTSRITGILPVNKGGTGKSTYSNGQLLIGSGTSLVANNISAGNNISIINGSGTILISSTGLQPSGNYSIVGHNHSVNDITNFNSSVSGLLPITNLTAGSGIGISQSGTVFTVATTGTFGLTQSQVDARVTTLTSGIYAPLSGSIFTGPISATTGNFIALKLNNIDVSLSGHTHVSSQITDFNASVDNRISNANLQPSGNYSIIGHTHVSNDITNFNSSVSGLLPVTSLSGISGVLVTNNGSNYLVSLNDPTIQLNDITDLSGNARNFLLNSTSSNFRTLITDETGSGSLVFNNSPTFIGIPLVPTASSGTNTQQIASTAFVRSEVSSLVNSAPSTLDTLNELAAALDNDPNFATTITNNLANKANLSGAIFTGSISGPSGNFTSLKTNNIDVSVSGHTHNSIDIIDFPNNLVYTSGDQNINGNLIISGSGIFNSLTAIGYPIENSYYTEKLPGIVYANTLILDRYVAPGPQDGPAGSIEFITNAPSTITLKPSDFDNTGGIYLFPQSGGGTLSIEGHTHISSNITDFNNSVSGLLPVKNIIGGSGIQVGSNSGEYTITAYGVAAASASALTTRCDNKTGSTIPKMTAVYINGGHGNRPTIQKAIALNEAGSSNTYGLTATNIDNDQSGDVVVVGELIDVNTQQFGVVEGTTLYLSPLVSGELTTTKPLTPYHLVSVGKIVRNHLTQGIIAVTIQNGFELGELHNVSTDSAGDNGKFLQYNSSSGLWLPSVSGNFSTLSVNGTGVSVSGHSHTSVPQAQSLVTSVFNKTGSSIPKFSVVYIDGGQGDQPTIKLAIASNEAGSSKTYGVTAEAISNMSSGNVVVAGALTGLNTDQFNPNAPTGDVNGTSLWLSPTVSGSVTTTKPYASNHAVFIGTIVRTHQNAGVVEVRVQNGYELEELHNVAVSGVSDGQFLQYNSASGLWVASSSGTFSTLNVSENLVVSSTGDINTLKINKFYHNNLGVSAGISDNDLLITITDPIGSPTTQVIQGSVLRSSLLNQPAVLRFRQGTETERLLITPASGEPIWTTDSQKLYIGDGTTVGGDFIGPSLYSRGSGIQSIVSLNTGCAASGNYSVVNGGINNFSIGTNSVVGGGSANTSSGTNSVVGGGSNNTSSGISSVVGGGSDNISSGGSSTISGGSFNNSSSSFSTVGGGYGNISSGNNSVVGGGSNNTSSGISSVVGGGFNNTSSGNSSTISGGQANLARSSRSFVSGSNNVASSTVRRANNITSSTNTITVFSATAADFDNTTANALQIRYFYNNAWNFSRRTVSSAVQSGNNVTLTLTSNVGSAGQTWSEVSVVNTSETETMVGGTVNGVNNICSNNHSTVGGGNNNISSGSNSTIGGGNNNISSGSNSTVCGGYANTSSGSRSTVGGGQGNTSSGSYSIIPGGTGAKTTRHGELSHSAGAFDWIGDAQHTILVARRQTTDATPNQVLLLDNSSARLTLPASTAWTFSIKLSAYNNTDNESGWWIIRGGIRRNHNNATTLVGSLITESGFESSLNAASVSVVADDTNEALEIRVTGVSEKTIRWVAVVDISQVSFGTP